jgi:hypothetical protein
LYIASCDPAVTLTLHPSLLRRACSCSWNSVSHSIMGDIPLVGAYCKPMASKSSSTLNKVCSLAEPSAAQEGAVNWTLVNGNNAALGFPARSEITPGVSSSGKSPRTTCVYIHHDGRREARLSVSWSGVDGVMIAKL